jgi:ubiquitin-conjugating enzyme E2 H
VIESWSSGSNVSTAEYVTKYATKENVDDAGADTDDSDEMSSVGSFDEEDEEPAGTMDEV